jgi:HlyD family secretion protein
VVPRRAVRPERGRLYVDLPKDQGLCGADLATWPPQPELTPVEVRTGLSNESSIAIESGLDERSCIYVAGLDARANIFEDEGPPESVREAQ